MSFGMMRTNVGAKKVKRNRISITSWHWVDTPKNQTRLSTPKMAICRAGQNITQPNYGNVPTCSSVKTDRLIVSTL